MTGLLSKESETLPFDKATEPPKLVPVNFTPDFPDFFDDAGSTASMWGSINKLVTLLIQNTKTKYTLPYSI